MTDHLNEIERRCVEAAKHQRLSVLRSGSSEAFVSSLRSLDVTVRRALESVLERQIELDRVLLEGEEQDVRDLERAVTESELARDRSLALSDVIFSRRLALTERLRERILREEAAAAARASERSSLVMRKAIENMENESGHPYRESLVSRSTADCVLFANELDASHLKDRVESVFVFSDRNAVDESKATNDHQKIVVDGKDELLRSHDLVSLMESLKQGSDALCACEPHCVPRQFPLLALIASETACLAKKRDTGNALFPKYSEMKQSMNRESSSEVAQAEELRRQVSTARQRLEEAHRDVFQMRKQMISLHRKLTEDQSRGSTSAAETLQAIKNELAMGKLDLLRMLCNTTTTTTGVERDDIADLPGVSKPQYGDSLRRPSASARLGSTSVAGGSYDASAAERPDAGMSRPAAQFSLQTTGTFTPQWQ